MTKNHINISTDAQGNCSVDISTKLEPQEALDFFYAMAATSIKHVSLSIPATAARDFILVQILGLLKKEGKTISVTWKDHEPGAHLLNTLKSLIHN